MDPRKCQIQLRDVSVMVYGVRGRPKCKSQKFSYSLRLVYRGKDRSEKKVEVWSESWQPFQRWVTTLSYLLKSPVPPISLLFLKAKKAALHTDFKSIKRTQVKFKSGISKTYNELDESLILSSFDENSTKRLPGL